MTPEILNTMRHQPNPIDWLRIVYNDRRSSEPTFSLRAFAKLIDLPSGRLTEILSGKRKLTPAIAEKIAAKLGLECEDIKTFVTLAARTRKGTLAAPVLMGTASHDGIGRSGGSQKQHSSDTFYVLADWYHQAIMSLMQTVDFQSDVNWIARRLGITNTEVKTAIDRLKRLKFIVEVEGEWVRSPGSLTTTHEISSAASKRFHRQTLEQATQAAEHGQTSGRDFSTLCIAFDPSRIEAVRELIKSFRRDVSTLAEAGEHTEVYHLNIQMVPVSKR